MKPGAFRPKPQEEDEPAVGTPQGVQILAFLCGLVVAFLGFKSTWSDYTLIDKMGHLDRFQETDGKFLKAGIRTDTLGATREYYPDVLYEYFVDGKSIWGWRLSYEEEPKPKAFWEGRVSGYAKGAAVKVFYNRLEPKDSILEKKHDGLYRVWMKMLLGLGFMLVGVLLAVLPLTGWLKRTPGRDSGAP